MKNLIRSALIFCLQAVFGLVLAMGYMKPRKVKECPPKAKEEEQPYILKYHGK